MKITTYDYTVEYYNKNIKHIHKHLGLSLTGLEYYKEYYRETYDIISTNITTSLKNKEEHHIDYMITI